MRLLPRLAAIGMCLMVCMTVTASAFSFAELPTVPDGANTTERSDQEARLDEVANNIQSAVEPMAATLAAQNRTVVVDYGVESYAFDPDDSTTTVEEAPEFILLVPEPEEPPVIAAASSTIEPSAGAHAVGETWTQDGLTYIQKAAYKVSEEATVKMALMIFCEAGNQPYRGQVAVGANILNRLDDARYPNTIVEIIGQCSNGRYQYSPMGNGSYKRAEAAYLNKGVLDESCLKAAREALSGVNNIGKRLYFKHYDKGDPIPKGGIVIGDHVFY